MFKPFNCLSKSIAGFLITGYRQTGLLRRSNSFFRPKTISIVAIIKPKSAAIASLSSPPFLLLALSLFPLLFLRVCFSFFVDVLVSAPPLLAFQPFAGQTIQLLYFCPKNEVVVVFVVFSFQ